MTELDCRWVTDELDTLFSRLAGEEWSQFEPDQSIYKKLESGEDTDFQEVTNLICQHLRLSQIPLARYEWGLKIPTHSAGQIREPGSSVSLIQIPLFYVGKPYLIGMILAHEICHQLLALKQIWYSDLMENERLTDLACFASGLGKLTLNGMSSEASGIQGLSSVLGYIEPELNLFAYKVTTQRYNLEPHISTANILSDVASRLEI